MKNLNLFLMCSLALVMAASCSKKNEPVNGQEPVAQTEDSVFNYTKVIFRSSSVNHNVNSWDYVPEAVTQEEINGVVAYIRTNPEDVSWPGYTYYYLQHVYSNEGATQYFQKLEILEYNDNWAKVNNCNAGKLNNKKSNNSVLMTNGFKAAKALNKNVTNDIHLWKLYYWNECYYLALEAPGDYSNKTYTYDGIYDNWILKILPGDFEPDITPDEEGNPVVDPSTVVEPIVTEGSVEFDIHQQENAGWNEIKTTIHLRDTVNARLFIPMPQVDQILQDDFALRVENQYSNVELEICDYSVLVNLSIDHQENGIEISIVSEDMEALKLVLRAARAVHNDGLTFEIHSYVRPEVTSEQIWNWLKTIECCQTSFSGKPESGQYVTHTYGQVTSAYYPEENIPFDKMNE